MDRTQFYFGELVPTWGGRKKFLSRTGGKMDGRWGGSGDTSLIDLPDRLLALSRRNVSAGCRFSLHLIVQFYLNLLSCMCVSHYQEIKLVFSCHAADAAMRGENKVFLSLSLIKIDTAAVTGTVSWPLRVCWFVHVTHHVERVVFLCRVIARCLEQIVRCLEHLQADIKLELHKSWDPMETWQTFCGWSRSVKFNSHVFIGLLLLSSA